MLTEANGPVDPRTAVTLVGAEPVRFPVGRVTAGTDVYPDPPLVTVMAVRLLVAVGVARLAGAVALPLDMLAV